MKKIALLTLSIFIIFGTFALATNSISIYKFQTPTGWIEETNPALASATASNEWTTWNDPNHTTHNGVAYVVLPATPNYYQLPQINWDVRVSQWIYLDINYLDFNMHVDMPGDYAIDNLNISVKTNGGINLYFNTPGDLKDGNGHSIPTWIGYVENDNGILLPPLGGSNSQFSWVKMNSLPNENNFITILKPYGTIHPCGLGTKVYQIWLGFRVAENTSKGNYSTYVDIFIQSDP